MKRNFMPPRWIDRFLRWRLPGEQFEELQGDMHELYQEWIEEVGLQNARRMYFWNAFTFLRPLPATKKSVYQQTYSYAQTNFFDMIANYLKTAFRNLLRHKAHFVINISGLSIGIACCLLIFLVVRYELSYETFHSKADYIYRVNSMMLPGKHPTAGAPMPIANALKQDFPEVEQATTTVYINEGMIKVDEQVYKEKGIAYIGPEYFDIFDTKWLAGNAQKALAEPNSVVLTRSLARKYFGGEANTIVQTALGKTIVFNIEHTLKVTGIIEDIPSNTDLPYKVLLSFSSLKAHAPRWDLMDWSSINGNVSHFVLLRLGTDPVRMESKFPAFDKKHMGAEEAAKHTEVLQPLREMHYDERFPNDTGRIMAKENIAGLILIGSFILLTACINFINLATAQSVKRSKEVGVRKVLGAERPQLVWQFLSETSLLSVFSMLIALGLAFLLVPRLTSLLELPFTFNPFTDLSLAAFLVAITLVVSVLAGMYPAMVLSGFQPINALKNKVTATRNGTFSLRRSLIVLQFAIAQMLIICTIIVANQLEYFRSKPLGFNKNAIITIPFSAENNPQTARTLRNQLLQMPGIKHVSFAVASPSSSMQSWVGFTVSGDPKEYHSLQLPVDHTYMQTFGLTLVAGKDLNINSDSSHVLVNETFLRWINQPDPQKAIGMQIKQGDRNLQVVGIVKDFYTGSLHNGVNAVIMLRRPYMEMAAIKIEPANMRPTIAGIEELWKKTYPGSVFEFEFLDETIANFYREETKIFNLFRIFAGIAIFISCLGLYGLVSFMAVQRNKEIGIRKVLGASNSHIVGLFTKEFFVLILVAFALAAPLAWYAMNSWIQNFENRLPLGISSFIIAIVFSLLIAGLTVIYRSVRAALANPVKSLRNE